MIEKIINSKSKTFLALCFCFLLGVLFISIFDWRFAFVYLYSLLFIIISFIIYFWSNKKLLFLFFCFLIFLLGVVRYQLSFWGQEISTGIKEFTAYISSEPDVRTDGVRYIVKSDFGKVYLKEPLYPRYSYGDELEIKCDLQKPEVGSDGFRYDMYLARYGVFTVCNKTTIEKIGTNKENFLLRGIFNFKNTIANRINKLWHEPYASFMAGLLYGYRGGLGSLNELFSRTGVTHIIAISGYNITIIVTILMTIFVNFYIPRKKAFWMIVAGVILFVIFTGASASVVRAGIMGIIVLLAKQMGRLSRVGNVLVLTAVIMALQNPLILLWDAGFQLSFISTLGLVYLSPFINSLIPVKAGILAIKNKIPAFAGMIEVLQESVVSTFSAIIATLPLILFQFGRLSIVAPVVNMLILWLIPFLMLSGFLALLFSFLFFPLGQVVAWLSWVGLKYITTIVEWFASLKFAAIDLQITWWMMAVLYGVMIYFITRHPREGGDLVR